MFQTYLDYASSVQKPHEIKHIEIIEMFKEDILDNCLTWKIYHIKKDLQS